MSARATGRAAALEAIRASGLIPIIRARSSESAARAAETLVEAGIGVVEITMTVPGALEVIRDVAARLGGRALVGAGTVTEAATARAAIEAGARFLVTPGLCLDVLEVARAEDVASIPGVLTPTEILAALRAGADLLKIFPVAPVGGPAYLRALRGPFPDAPLVPTGGVALESIPDYFAAGAFAVGVGGELVSRAALEQGDFSALAALAARYTAAVEAGRRGAGRP
ncbi:MAG TPA: bifunctional 4-hydroxy-2-oxoglutarate aldolase/2-dehydro-3-deoxy-phosphogluconate aldolase [Vicinamibacterales bacterium]|nr:bifunctional 4-hydroxy-2-oxoglutarate aldolase/2-dehydro-3-deoxy-phosphogluconate aldolase [Vicinamibacterales bacterium]